MDIDPDDPATWPDDLDSLQKLADGEMSLTAPDAAAEEPEPEPEPEATEVEEPEAEAPEAEEPEPPPEAAEAEDKPVQGVLTADGKHIIPWGTYDRIRKENADLKRRLEAQQAPPPPPEDPKTQPLWQRSEAEIAQHLEKIRDEYGDVVANQERTLLDMQRQQAEERQARETARQSQQEQAAAVMQAAVEETPKLLAWQNDDDPVWYDRASDLYAVLQKDPAYAALTPPQQFAQLVEKVEAVYGPSPHAVRPVNGSGLPKPRTAAVATPKSQPTSHSDLPGGEPPPVSELTKLERMSDRQLMAHFERMTPDQQEAYLSRIS